MGVDNKGCKPHVLLPLRGWPSWWFWARRGGFVLGVVEFGEGTGQTVKGSVLEKSWLQKVFA